MDWGRHVGALTAIGSVLVLTALGAQAKSTYESPYGYDRTWNAAVRLVRVDNGWKVTEKDDQSGYLLFDYQSPENRKVTPGTLELVRGKESDGPVSVLVQLPEMPHYHEQVLLDSLAVKMRREYGDPPDRRKKPPVETPPDAGADAPAD